MVGASDQENHGKAMKKRRREIRGPADHFIVSHAGYPFDVMVVIAKGEEETRTILRDFEGIEEKELADLELPGPGQCVMFDSGPTLIYLSNWTGTPEHHGQLAHEIFHAVSMLMRHINSKLRRESEEPYAYAIQALTRAIMGELSKPPSKRRR